MINNEPMDSNKNTANSQNTFSVAPMLDWTDRHCRYFHRLLTRHALLYTEMVTTGALLHGDRRRFLAYNPEEHPLALQLGGSNPRELAVCAKMAEAYGYDEVNLNVGCPSDRVQNGRFGACLMAEPDLVADCVAAMAAAVQIPVTVKTRIGIDDQDSYPELAHFIGTVAQGGCQRFIVHARKAWLSGLSPKQNREVPPLRYEVVYRLKTDFPALEFILNGGLTAMSQIEAILPKVDGVMVGREAYHNPYFLAEVDRRIFGENKPVLARAEVVARLLPYLRQQLAAGIRLNSVTRHLIGLFHGQYGGRAFRRHLSENATRRGADESVLLQALTFTRHDVY